MKSWNIYYDRFKYKSITRDTNEITITKNTNIDELLKNIFN